MDEQLAVFHTKHCNFRTAKKIYSQLIRKSKDNLEDKVHFEAELERVNSLYSLQQNLQTGEAFFPVYHKERNVSSLCKAVFTESNTPGNVDSDIRFILKQAAQYLDNILKDIKPEIMVLDWGIENLTVNFRLPDNNPLLEKMDGKSYLLAVAAAAMSYLIGQQISFNKVFTGVIRDGDTNIFQVDALESKLEIIKAERLKLWEFFVPEGSNLGQKRVIPVKTLTNFFDRLFGKKIIDFLKRKNNPGKRRISVELLKNIPARDGKKHAYALFRHPEDLTNDESKRIMSEYLQRAFDLLASKQGVIVDGLRPAYLYARLGSLAKEQYISNFMAVRRYNADDKNENISRAFVFVVAQGGANRSLGESFEYFLPKTTLK